MFDAAIASMNMPTAATRRPMRVEASHVKAVAIMGGVSYDVGVTGRHTLERGAKGRPI
jgi:hypothetical protein